MGVWVCGVWVCVWGVCACWCEECVVWDGCMGVLVIGCMYLCMHFVHVCVLNFICMLS